MSKLGLHPVPLLLHKWISGIRRIRCIYPLLLLGFWLVGCDDDPLTDLSILSVEVVPGASTSAATVSLAAQGGTTVQVRLATDSSYDVTGVMGVLSVSVAGEIVETNLAAVNEPITVPSTGEREDASLYFELEAPASVAASSDVDFFVTLTAPGQFLQSPVSPLTFSDPSSSSDASFVREPVQPSAHRFER